MKWMKKHQKTLVMVAGLTMTVTLSGCVALAVGGAAVGAAVLSDSRSAGTQFDDEALENKVILTLQKAKTPAHVNVVSYNKVALITGEAPTSEEKSKVEWLVRGTAGVKKVYNYVDVMPNSDYTVRSNDSLITSKVRSNMTLTKGLSDGKIKILTERNVVYLMGLVTKEQGGMAADIASRTAGVKNVVTLFEYQN
jgi:osmotically-inducible protein OsmY